MPTDCGVGKTGPVASLLSIRVTPRSAKPGIGDWKTDPGGRPFLEVRVASAPAGGAANEEVIELLAKALGLPKSSLTIVSGQAARLKRVELPFNDDEVRVRLGR